MRNKKVLRFILVPLLVCSAINAQTVSSANSPARAVNAADDLSANLSAIEAAVESKRKELGIPGLALAIVKDDKVIFARGFGVKDLNRNSPVTANTLFAIGSCTKAFTSMAAMMSVDEKKLSLDDSPKKYIPYFRIDDPEIDSKVTIRDMLSHRTGLTATELIWYTGKLTREEVIRAAGYAKPTAKLGEKFQYQNVMYSAAGEAVARAQQTTWEDLITKRLLLPLGMKSTTLDIWAMKRSPDYSVGYELLPESTTAREVPMREISNIAPAGAINSSVNDMAQWLRLMLGEGVYEGKRFVSEQSFNELSKPEISTPFGKYGLGWGIVDFNGHKVVTHSGAIDGFNSMVSLMPDQHLGYVLLTNVSGSPIGVTVLNSVFGKLGAPAAPQTSPTEDLQSETGKYHFDSAGIDVDISVKDGNLIADAPGHGTFTLVRVGARKYKVDDPSMDGCFVTFRPASDNPKETEIYFETPQGNTVLPRISAPAAPVVAAVSQDALKEGIGMYTGPGEVKIEIKMVDDKVSLVAPSQPPYPLYVREKDVLASHVLPETYSALLKRDEKGVVTGLSMRQPNGTFEFSRVQEGQNTVSVIDTEELNRKMVEAVGGESNLRKFGSRVETFSIVFENQGIAVDGTAWNSAPNSSAREMVFSALGKKLATVHEYFDGTNGGSDSTFLLPSTLKGTKLGDAKISSDFYELFDWKKLYKSVAATGTQNFAGEDCYAVRFTPVAGTPFTLFVSRKSFLVVGRAQESAEGGTVLTTLSDFRPQNGIVAPYKVVQMSTSDGRVVITVKDMQFGVNIPAATFQAHAGL